MKIVIEGKSLEKLNEVIGDLRHKTVQEIQPLIQLLNENVVQDPVDGANGTDSDNVQVEQEGDMEVAQG